MPYCPNCGKDVQPGEMFCPTCGTSLQQGQTDQGPPTETGYTSSQTYTTNQPGYSAPPPGQQGYAPPPPVYPGVPLKSPGVALILGLILGLFGLMGIGQIYAGKIARGIIILILGLIVVPMMIVIAFMGATITFGAVWILLPVISIIMFVLWIWQSYDAYVLTKRFNEGLQRTGVPPW